jgi:hypothetical protein
LLRVRLNVFAAFVVTLAGAFAVAVVTVGLVRLPDSLLSDGGFLVDLVWTVGASFTGLDAALAVPQGISISVTLFAGVVAMGGGFGGRASEPPPDHREKPRDPNVDGVARPDGQAATG